MKIPSTLHTLGATTLLILASCTHAVEGAIDDNAVGSELRSGERIQLGAGQTRGPLAIGLSSETVGTVTLPGDAEPSLIVTPGGHNANPGVFFARFLERDAQGVPVFANPVEIDHPRGRDKLPYPAAVFTDAEDTTWGLWVKGDKILRTTFDTEALAFVDHPAGPITVTGLPGNAGWLAARPASDGEGIDLVFGIKDDIPNKPNDPGVKNWRDPLYRPYDGAGVYRGGWPYITLYSATLDSIDASSPIEASQASTTKREALLSLGNLTPTDIDGQAGYISGSWFGNFKFYPAGDNDDGGLEPGQFLTDADGLAMRHPTVRPMPITYPAAEGNLVDLIVGGEGALYLYRHESGMSYADPVYVLEQNAEMYAGSLPVVSAVDWDGDERMDLIAGNSEGKILWFRNVGTNAAPSFKSGIELEAGGEPIHIQTGYNNVQGPQEARWSYVSPGVFDWTEDGLPDLLVSSSTTRHELFRNIGTRTAPKLADPVPLYSYGLELHGTWRVRPHAAQLGDSIGYVMLDDQDEFHLYRKIDDQNVSDAGKLTLEDGSTIGGNFLSAGGTGRLKFTLVDWDLDGKTDLLVGTPRHASIPDPEHGLPQSLGLKGAAVVFLKNVGSDQSPVFAKPVLMKYKGEPIYVGQHACSAAVWDIGQSDGPDLIVGEQGGRILFYARQDLSW